MARNERDFDVQAGETFHPTLRWGSGLYASKPITAISKATPVVVTAAGHGLPNGWPCACVGVQGMTQINDPRYPPTNWRFGNVLTPDTVQLNEVSSAEYTAYTSGGFLVYDTPATLAGMTFTMNLYSDPECEGVLTSLVSTNPAQIAVDDTLKTITPHLQTAALTWDTAYYRLDVADGSGVVTELLRGIIRINP